MWKKKIFFTKQTNTISFNSVGNATTESTARRQWQCKHCNKWKSKKSEIFVMGFFRSFFFAFFLFFSFPHTCQYHTTRFRWVFFPSFHSHFFFSLLVLSSIDHRRLYTSIEASNHFFVIIILVAWCQFLLFWFCSLRLHLLY